MQPTTPTDKVARCVELARRSREAQGLTMRPPSDPAVALRLLAIVEPRGKK